MIQIKNLQKSFGKNEVLRGVDLEVNKSGIVAVLGPNGSGKTTIIKTILGMVVPDGGEILVQGTNIKNNDEYRRNISYLAQIAQFPENILVEELIKMVKDIRGQVAHLQDLINVFGLEDSLKKPLKDLSGGTRQKVNIVLAFMFDNPILILDEPTVGLDPIALIKLKQLILSEKEKGKVILLTTHIVNLVEELADDIIFLLDGKIYFNGSKEALVELSGESNLELAIARILENSGDLGTTKNVNINTKRQA